MYDVIVIGARCAGASTAMLLARAGMHVLLVDRAELGSDIPHGHFVQRHGPARLAAWGLLDSILATNCPAVTSMIQDFDDFPLAGHDLVVDGVPFAVAPRHGRLDAVLAEAAVAAGAELRDRFAVVDYTRDGDRITGIVGRDARTGARATEQASIVVGADGRNSGLAHSVGATACESAPTATCWYFSYYSGVSCPGLELYARPDHVIFAFPTNDELVGLFVGYPSGDLARVRADVEANMLDAVDRIPGLGERIRAGDREERFYGATQLPNFIRTPHGPGWALVGDAGCHKDPFMALGICDALRDAELLADALGDGLGGRRPLDAALAGYERLRNAATLPDYHLNLAMARFEPIADDHRRLRAALRHDQESTNHFYRATQAMVGPETFFNDANLGRIIMAGAARAASSATA
jgi:flavin-dependent dehydrogenase